MHAFELSRDMETEIQTIPPLLGVDINPGYKNETMSPLWIPTLLSFHYCRSWETTSAPSFPPRAPPIEGQDPNPWTEFLY